MVLIESLGKFLSKAKYFNPLIQLLIVAAASLLLVACGSGGSSASNNSSDPVVEGPIAGAPTLLGSTSFTLADVGYEQSEYFISGQARSYANTKTATNDGKWSVHVVDQADYKTRIVVYRPINPAAFNGTVVIEWLNVTGSTDAAPGWTGTHTELIRKGYAWVGVSAQRAGVDGGGVSIVGAGFDLKSMNPARYASLQHPGDKYAYDIFSQVAQVVQHPHNIDPLAGLRVQRSIAFGQSQSADFMVTYINAIAPIAKLFDGYFVQDRFHGTTGLTPPDLFGSDFGTRTTVRIRDDIDVPVMVVQAETDLFFLGSYSDRQDDNANLRWWEIAGSAHGGIDATRNNADVGTDPNTASIVEIKEPVPSYAACDKPINSEPAHFVASAAMAALDIWVRHGVAPAHADRLEVAGEPAAFVKDSVGNVLGGIRTPYVDVPIAILSGEGNGSGFLCQLFGTTQIFDRAQLASLYHAHATFVSKINTSVDRTVSAGFLLPQDGDLIKAWAQASTIGSP